jgi:hypothetical protein
MLLLRSVVTRTFALRLALAASRPIRTRRAPRRTAGRASRMGPPVPADDVIADVVLSLAPAVVPSTRKPIRHVPPAPSEPPL